MKLKPNSLREAPAVCVSPSFPLQRQFLCALPRSTVFSWHRARASDIGAGRMSGQQTADLFPVPPLLYFVFCSVTLPLLLSRINPPSSFTLVSLCAAFFLPRQSIYLWLASSSRAAPGVKWRTVGGRARELGHLTARSLPCWHDPRYVMRARTRARTQTLTQDSVFLISDANWF